MTLLSESLSDTLPGQEVCCGCGIATEKLNGPVHEYLGSSTGCWQKFGEVLAREYSDYQYMAVHNLTVDAYALQHPGVEEPRTISSANVHLASLFAYFVRNVPVHDLSTIKQKLTAYKNDFVWLAPPDSLSEITVVDVLKNERPKAHKEAVTRWSKYVFEGWSEHHCVAERLCDKID